MGKKKKQEKQKKQKEKLKKLEKLEKQKRLEKQEKPEKQDKPKRLEEQEKQDKPKRQEKQEKTEKLEKLEKQKRLEKQEKPEKQGQPKRQEDAAKKAPEPDRKRGAGAVPANAGSAEQNRVAAERFRALGDENRLRILELLADRELCAADILKSMSIVQSTLSHHMKILTESGIVNCRKQGKWSYYSIDRDVRARLAELIGQWGWKADHRE